MLAIGRRQHVFGPHGGRQADLGGFVAVAGGDGADLPGALEVDAAPIEHSREVHEAIHARHFVRIGGEFGQFLLGFTVLV